MRPAHIPAMKLSHWLDREKRTDSWLAERVGRDRSIITRIKNGDALPSVEVAAKIQVITEGMVTATDYERRQPAGAIA